MARCFVCSESLPQTREGEGSTEETESLNRKQQNLQTLIRLFGFLHNYGYSSDEKKAIKDSRFLQSLQKPIQAVSYCKICTLKLQQVSGVLKLYDNLGQKLQGYQREIVDQLTICSGGSDEESKLREEIIAEFVGSSTNIRYKRPRCRSLGSGSQTSQKLSTLPRSAYLNPVLKLRRLEDDPTLTLHQNFKLNENEVRVKQERDPDYEHCLDNDNNMDMDADMNSELICPGLEANPDPEYNPPSPKRRKTKGRSRKKTDKARPRLRPRISKKKPSISVQRSTKITGIGCTHSLIDVPEGHKLVTVVIKPNGKKCLPDPKADVSKGGRPLRACQPVFPCDFEGCDFRGRTEAATQYHLQRVHPEAQRPHACSEAECGVTFIREERLTRHKHWAHSDLPYPCQDCDFICKRKETMKIHIFRVHGIGGQGCPYEGCTYIGPPGGVRLHLESSIHQDKGHGKRKHMCQHCGKTFIAPQQLKYHLNSRHPELVSDPAELERHRCQYCGKLSCSPPELKKHIKAVHLRQFDIHCEVCGKGVTSLSQLRKHMRAHQQPEEFEFACEVCHAKFRQKERLNVHMRRHTGELKFCCVQCDRKFVDSSSLRRHEKIHAGVLKHVCHICNKGFPVLDYLRTHLNSHATPEERKARRERQQQNKTEFPVLNRIYNDLRKQRSNVATVPADPNLKADGPVAAYPMHYDYRRERKQISRILEPEELVGGEEAPTESKDL